MTCRRFSVRRSIFEQEYSDLLDFLSPRSVDSGYGEIKIWSVLTADLKKSGVSTVSYCRFPVCNGPPSVLIGIVVASFSRCRRRVQRCIVTVVHLVSSSRPSSSTNIAFIVSSSPTFIVAIIITTVVSTSLLFILIIVQLHHRSSSSSFISSSSSTSLSSPSSTSTWSLSSSSTS